MSMRSRYRTSEASRALVDLVDHLGTYENIYWDQASLLVQQAAPQGPSLENAGGSLYTVGFRAVNRNWYSPTSMFGLPSPAVASRSPRVSGSTGTKVSFS